MIWNSGMAEIVSNTSPLLYLYRIQVLDWLPALGRDVWIPKAVELELEEGRRRGYDVPDPARYDWLRIVDPGVIPSEWLTLDLGRGELAALALALEHPKCTVLLDDRHARRVAASAGLDVRGTLGVLIEAKTRGLTEHIEPLVDRLENAGMWMSEAIRSRVLALAGEERTGESPGT